MGILRTAAIELVVFLGSSTCSVAQLSNTPREVRGTRLEAVVRFGFSRGTPVGLEIVDLRMLEGEIAVNWDVSVPAKTALQMILGLDSGLLVRELDGALVVGPTPKTENVLDTVISEFGRHRSHLSMLDWALHRSLQYSINPAPQPGIAGTLATPRGTPWIDPLGLRNASVRSILSAIVVTAPGGGLWLADGGVRRGDSLDPPLWRIVSYRQDEAYAQKELETFVRDRIRIAERKLVR